MKDKLKKTSMVTKLRFSAAALIVLLTFFLSGCGRQEIQISGKTMGTTYRVKIVGGYFTDAEKLKEKIEKRLLEINRSMSTFQAESEISRFNGLTVPGEKFPASNDFLAVFETSETIHRLTGGAWDGTVLPLVRLWGFHRSGGKARVPESEEVARLLPDIGFHNIRREDRHLFKNRGGVTLDLASIAKGYGVDAVAALLTEAKLSDFLVEIGGDLYASGVRIDGTPWRIGINMPDKDAPIDQVYRSIPLSGKGMATSGDYRNFFEIEGKRYSHVLDPRSGYPVSNGVLSVSVTAGNCTFADGLATALMVLGPEEGVSLVERLPGVECLILVRTPDGGFAEIGSSRFGL
jgi:FAD:protein FMN transferase